MTQTPEITQEMVLLYDEYTHVTLDRRRFMDRMSKLAGSTAAAAAIVPLLEANYAHAAMVAADDSRLKTETVTIPGAEAGLTGYLAIPANAAGKLPGVVVIHENRGLNPHIQTSPGARRWKGSSRWRPISCRRSAARRTTRTRRAT